MCQVPTRRESRLLLRRRPLKKGWQYDQLSRCFCSPHFPSSIQISPEHPKTRWVVVKKVDPDQENNETSNYRVPIIIEFVERWKLWIYEFELWTCATCLAWSQNQHRSESEYLPLFWVDCLAFVTVSQLWTDRQELLGCLQYHPVLKNVVNATMLRSQMRSRTICVLAAMPMLSSFEKLDSKTSGLSQQSTVLLETWDLKEWEDIEELSRASIWAYVVVFFAKTRDVFVVWI